ncbi:hypothetical protein [Streptomyces sp. MB09-02B]|nr:hypothetical protein [Streptomyces sp. MB09-02B]MDX3638788.1 hypothetical protein [Streptomyces sp. MB09-02B]
MSTTGEHARAALAEHTEYAEPMEYTEPMEYVEPAEHTAVTR